MDNTQFVAFEMSETYNEILTTIKAAMKDGNTVARNTLRMVVSDIKNKTVNEGKVITEEVVVSCLKKFAKLLDDSIASANAAGRNDLVEKATKEKAVVSQFLPQKPSELQMQEFCRVIYSNFQGKTFGELMKMIPAIYDKKFCAKVLQGLFKEHNGK